MPPATVAAPAPHPMPASVPAATSRLEAEHLQKSYGARMVVKDVHLAVGAGEVVGLLGPNGAGKTTTFYMVVGLVRADAGEIRIDGRPVQTLPIHRRSRLGLSYLPQEASIFRKLTVAENIRAVLELQLGPDGRSLPKRVVDEELEKLLHDLSIEKLRDSPAPALSGGERRRVEIARALATQPRFTASCARAASACSSPTTTCARRWASATAPTSSATAVCSPRARRTRSWPTPRCARCTWANISACDMGPPGCSSPVATHLRAFAAGPLAGGPSLAGHSRACRRSPGAGSAPRGEKPTP